MRELNSSLRGSVLYVIVFLSTSGYVAVIYVDYPDSLVPGSAGY